MDSETGESMKNMNREERHICVCICTYKRPHLVQNLLLRLQSQRTDSLFTYSIVVVDNDRECSARSAAHSIMKESLIPVKYCNEPEKNIAMARNMAVKNADGGFVAFIDDDEFPEDDWLLNLYQTCYACKVAGVLGPVMPHFEAGPPNWLIKGKFCERPTYETGTVIPWDKSRTGNVLLKKSLFQGLNHPFDPEFGIQGEDVNFFREMHERGHVFVWCKTAPVYEVVPHSRCTKSYYLKRAFLQGNVSCRYDNNPHLGKKAHVLLKSSVASVAYTLILPFSWIGGLHIFMKYLIKDLHHISRLLGFFNLVRIRERTF